MVDRIVEEMVMFDFEYISPISITVEETVQGVAVITGTLLAEGISGNGNVYTIAEMENIVKQAEGQPIFVGVKPKMVYNPELGLWQKNKHDNTSRNRVGKIIRAVLDKIGRKIKFWAELVNTTTHPHIVEEVKQGWGISIGGVATRAKIVLDMAGRLLTKILGLDLNHVQLIPPTIARGQRAAKVEGIEIQETMQFYEIEKPELRIKKINIGSGISKIRITYSEK